MTEIERERELAIEEVTCIKNKRKYLSINLDNTYKTKNPTYICRICSGESIYYKQQTIAAQAQHTQHSNKKKKQHTHTTWEQRKVKVV